MYVIGITGPTGAGKTTALRVLEQLGGQVVDCDAVYHELLQTDGALLGRIEAAFPGVVKDWTLDRKALGSRVYADPAALQTLTDLTWPAVRREVERRLKEAETSQICRPERSASRPKAWLVPPSTALRHDPQGPTGALALNALTESKDPFPPSPVTTSKASASGGRPMTAPTGFAVIDAIGLFESGLAGLCDLTAAVTADEEVRVRRLMARDNISEAYARSRIAAQKPASWFAERADLELENNGTEAEFAEKCRAELIRRLAPLLSRSGR